MTRACRARADTRGAAAGDRATAGRAGFVPSTWCGTLALLLSVGPVAADPAKPTLRIWEWDGDFYQTITDGCASALEASAASAGLTTRVFRTRAAELDQNPDDTVTVGVVPTTASLSLFAPGPKGTAIFDEVAPFTGPPHFIKFLNGDLYRSLYADVPAPFFFSHRATIGVAYGSAAQIFTSDKPIRTPAELRGRTQLGTFGDWWYVSLHDELGIGHDAVLGHTDSTIEAQHAALIKAAKGMAAGSSFIVAPLLMATKIVPPELRTYVSLTMTHTSFVSFVAEPWDKATEEQKAVVSRVVTEAAKFCSAQNFDRERSAISQMKLTGSTVVPVDIAAFQILSVTILERGIDEARADLQKARADKDDVDTKEYVLRDRQEQLNFYSRLQQLR